jgi:putative ABC transport system permease protein
VTIPFSYSSRSLWARRATTAATAGGIALVVFVLSASQMLSAGMRSTLLRAGRDDKAIVMQRDAYAEIDSRLRQGVLTAATGAPGVRHAASGEPLVSAESLVQLFVPCLDEPSRFSSVQVRGVSDNVLALRPEVRVVHGRLPRPGSDEAMIGSGIENTYEGLALGGHFNLKKGRDIQLVGVFEADGSAYESELWTGLDVVRTSMGWEGYVSSITAALESSAAFDGFASRLELDESEGLGVARERAYYDKVSEGLSRSVQALGDLVSIIFACGALLGAAITMNAAIAQRRREIGVLRALGFSSGQVLLAFLLESTVLALAGATIGAGLACFLSLASFSATNYGTGNEITFPFQPTPLILLRSILSGALVGVLGGFFPALQAARTSPVRALRA